MGSKVIHPISFEDYVAQPGVNQSLLKHFADSPAHVLHYMESEHKPTDAMVLGSIVDSMLLGTEFGYTTSPFDSFRTKDARAWRGEQEAKGIRVVSQDVVEKANAMADAVRNHSTSAGLLEGAKTSVCALSDGKKALIDVVPDGVDVLIDLKTTRDANPHEFEKQIFKLFYHVQAAWYLDVWHGATGENREQFAFLVVSSSEPYCAGCYVLDQESIQLGREQAKIWLDRFHQCKETNNWPGFGDKPRYVGVPKWATLITD